MEHIMFSFNDIYLSHNIYNGLHSLVFRGYRISDKTPLIIKILKDEYPSQELLARFKFEFEVLNTLRAEGTVLAYSLINYKKSLAILMEDFGTHTLQGLLTEHP